MTPKNYLWKLYHFIDTSRIGKHKSTSTNSIEHWKRVQGWSSENIRHDPWQHQISRISRRQQNDLRRYDTNILQMFLLPRIFAVTRSQSIPKTLRSPRNSTIVYSVNSASDCSFGYISHMPGIDKHLSEDIQSEWNCYSKHHIVMWNGVYCAQSAAVHTQKIHSVWNSTVFSRIGHVFQQTFRLSHTARGIPSPIFAKTVDAHRAHCYPLELMHYLLVTARSCQCHSVAATFIASIHVCQHHAHRLLYRSIQLLHWSIDCCDETRCNPTQQCCMVDR